METKTKKAMHVTGNSARRKKSLRKASQNEPQIQIVYTPAKPFNRNRFLLRLATVVAVVLALVCGMSIFFKAKNVMVSGTEKYSPWDIKEASGIKDSDGLLSISEAKISARIRAKLPYVGNVRVGIKLPDTVNIEITELDAVYAVKDDAGAWWLMDAQGRIVDKASVSDAMEHTRIEGVQVTGAVVGQQASAFQPEEGTGSQEDASEAPVLPDVSAGQRLQVAVEVLKALEKNGVLSGIETVDVSELNQLAMWYGSRYHVTLGTAERLAYKIGAMKAAIQKMGEYQNGYLDVSFTTWSDQVGFTPFE